MDVESSAPRNAGIDPDPRATLAVPAGTLIIDVTSSASQPYTSGIQRVVRALAACSNSQDIVLAEFSPQNRQWHLVDPAPILRSSTSPTRAGKIMLRSRQAYHHALQFPGASQGIKFAIERFRGQYEMTRRTLGGQGWNYGPALRLTGPSTFLLAEVSSGRAHAEALELQTLRDGHGLAMFVHDLMPLTNPEWFTADPRHDFAAYRRLIESARQVATSSTHVVNAIRQSGPPRKPATVFPLPSFAASRRNRPPTSPSFLLVGAMTGRKNAANALRAAIRLADQDHPLGLTFVAHPSPVQQSMKRLVRLARERGVGISTRRFLSDEHLGDLYRSSTAALCISLGEGYGLPVVESLAHGTPVIASNREPLSDFAEFGGVSLVDPLDVAAIADAMHRMMDAESWSRASNSIDHASLPVGWASWARGVIQWARSS